MLYIDGISVSKLKNELNEALKSKRVTKIFQYSKLRISIFLGKINLYISANANLPICYITSNKEVAPDKPMKFSLSCKKYLLRSFLTSVNQYRSDRILILSFAKINELGILKKVKLIIEIMGKHSNIILVDDNNSILDSLKKFSIEENKFRQLFIGTEYKYPTITPKILPNDITKEQFDIYKKENSLINKVEGVGKLADKHILTFEEFGDYLDNVSPTVYKKDDNITYGTIKKLPLLGYDKIHFETINEMIDFYILETVNSEEFNNNKKTLTKTILKELKKNKKIINNIDRDIKKYSTYNRYKQIGDILAANLYSIKGRESSITLFDFYNSCNIEIMLNSKKSANENLNKYYTLYKKHQRGYKYSLDREKTINSEIEYLKSILSFIDSARDKKILDGIMDELILNRYIKSKIVNKKPKKNIQFTASTIKIEGFTLYYGRNNFENDYVTFKLGAKNDIWFHAKNIPGSHLILKSNGEKLTDEILEKIGQLAIKHSKVQVGETVQIDYCLKKYVKKIKGAKPGLVIYSNEKSLFIKK